MSTPVPQDGIWILVPQEETPVLLFPPAGNIGSGGGSGVSDHGALSGLADDDHAQYHTDARGDARYSGLAHTHTGTYEPANANLQAHIGSTSNPHSVTAAQVGADATGTAASAVSAHSGAVDPHGDRAYADGLAGNYATAGHNHSGVYQPLATVLTNTTAAFTTAQESKLSGIEAAADVTDAGNVGAAIDGATAKTTPVDADTVPLIDSAASNVLKKLSWANIKATAKTYFDTLYQAASATLTTWAGITPGTGIATALGTNVGTAGSVVVNGGALGTPSSGNLANCTGYPAAGSTTQVLFNDAGAIAGDAGMTYNKTTDTLTVVGPVVTTSKIQVPVASAAAPSFTFTGDTTSGFYSVVSGTVSYAAAGVPIVLFSANTGIGTYTKAMRLKSTAAFGWSSGDPDLAADDLMIVRDAANRIAVRRTTNAQTLIVSGTFTDTNNLVQAELGATSTAVTLSAVTAGTGADDVPVSIVPAGAAGVIIGASGAGAAKSVNHYNKSVTGIADATATTILTVTVPNAAHSASIEVVLSGSLGAGGAIGANEATGTIIYNVSIARTAGVNAVATISTAYGSSTSAVAGAATITVTGDLGAVSGAVGATNTFTIRATITKGSGASANHTCVATARVLNANATGITIA